MLTLAELLVINTSDTPADRETPCSATRWRPSGAGATPAYVGEPRVDRVVFRVVAEADGRQRAVSLDDVGQRAERLLS